MTEQLAISLRRFLLHTNMYRRYIRWPRKTKLYWGYIILFQQTRHFLDGSRCCLRQNRYVNWSNDYAWGVHHYEPVWGKSAYMRFQDAIPRGGGWQTGDLLISVQLWMVSDVPGSW